MQEIRAAPVQQYLYDERGGRHTRRAFAWMQRDVRALSRICISRYLDRRRVKNFLRLVTQNGGSIVVYWGYYIIHPLGSPHSNFPNLKILQGGRVVELSRGKT